MWAEAYLLTPASMHTPLREPHTHFHARIAFGLALDFLVLLYLPARSRFGEGTVKTKERNGSYDSCTKTWVLKPAASAKLLMSKH